MQPSIRTLSAAIGLLVFVAHTAATTPTTQYLSDTPKSALKALAKALAIGDAPAIREAMRADDPTQRALADEIATNTAAMKRLTDALALRFGQGATGQLFGDTEAVLREGLLRIDQAEEKIDGDSATVSMPGTAGRPGDVIDLRRVDGHWQVSLARRGKELGEQQLQENLRTLAWQRKLYDEIAAELAAGKYSDASEAAAAIRQKMQSPPPTTSTTAPNDR